MVVEFSVARGTVRFARKERARGCGLVAAKRESYLSTTSVSPRPAFRRFPEATSDACVRLSVKSKLLDFFFGISGF